MWTTWTAGLLTGLALIVAIGAQNAFVLRQGIRREHVGVVVLVCLLSDALLILAGTAGIGVIVEKVPVVLEILRWGGAAYLIWFAVQSVRSAFSPTSLTPEKPRSKGSVLTTTLALTYLNPHVYLDTVVLLGSLANQQGPDLRWVFAGGAVVGSIVWFSALGYGARALAPVLDRPRAWQIVDLVIAAVMLALVVSLILR
ncbi:LysE/ArgO family amino acid transporter [Micrococcus terreus]|uniref:LysE/ArgO family amino acid transporter n=1 Tax=Micrococcus terreus TaxID=574650 RepID=UPI0021A6E804|nr:LysE/ArgO family amino acid transporter [Micrococcus terreus]MCT2087802.1 LysE/ArgO family amino acid transporter [Micrococcus terreus]MDK7700358.1 LysE/ArgO family amino acid transporter [Micrococcus terreus]WOO96499.1 LysE/ArgO family amino acid transporter [Micrococcus terreus]